MKELSIYIHIPFCESKCYYCNFVSCVSSEKKEYFKALYNEISEFKNKDYLVKTIYFGGGTPSSVEPIFIKKILKQIYSKFKIDKNVEITIECNPTSTTIENLTEYKKMEINRISFGVQTFNKKSLNFVGRTQNNFKKNKGYKSLVFRCLKQAKKLGFDNISVDIILGLPYQKNRDVKKCLHKLSKFVQHFSCYMLILEKNTKLYKLLPEGLDESKSIKQYEITVKLLEKLGFNRYEISNFSKKGFESKHNNTYWTMGEYAGFGVAAHSFIGKKRIANTESLQEYISFYIKNNNCGNNDFENKNIENNNTKDKEKETKNERYNIKTVENISKKSLAEEKIMLGLRLKKGIDLIEFRKDFYDIEKKKAKELALLLNNGFIEFENNFLRLSDKGFLVSNAVILEIIS